MIDFSQIEPGQILTVFLIAMGISLVFAILLAIYVVRSVRRINLPPNADPVTALMATPFVVVLLLDLLDFSLDFLSAPFAWTILNYLGLKPLRGITIVESLIPGTQAIPTMTLAWFLVRAIGPERLRRLF